MTSPSIVLPSEQTPAVPMAKTTIKPLNTNGMVTNDVVTNDVVTNGRVTNGIVTNGIVTNDIVTNDIVTNDIVTNDIVTNDIVTNDIVTNDIVTNDIVTNDIVTNDIVTNDIVTNDIVTNDIVTNGIVTNGIVTNGKATSYDRFKLGWRLRPRLSEEGYIVYDRIPLTSYDILHPQEGDFRVHNHEHMGMCNYLVNVLESRVAQDPHAVVLHDTRVAWDEAGPDAHGPDIALIFGVREVKKWGTFDVNVEGTRPTLIIEVTSPETRTIDLNDKPDQYEQAGVRYFIIIDTHIGRQQPAYRLIGRELTANGYIDMQPDARGWLWLDPIQVWIGLNQNRLECYDVHGIRIGDYVDLTVQRDEATQRAEQERLRAEQERLRAEAEANARTHAEAQTEQERLRAKAEAEARIQVEAKLARMMALLQASGIDTE